MPRRVYATPPQFWSQIAAQGECWIWQGKASPNGYGQFGHGFAHRWIYEFLIGEIPAGLELDHLCRVRNCVNPYHLDPVTHAENCRRTAGLKRGPYNVGSYCKNGHDRTPENTRITAKGWRTCIPCGREAVARHRSKQATA